MYLAKFVSGCLIAFTITLAISLFGCSPKRQAKPSNSDSAISNQLATEASVEKSQEETANFLGPVPLQYIVPETEFVDDSTLVIFTSKCVVFSNYSESELAELEKKMDEEQWEAFYDDMAYYGNEDSLFLYDKTKVERVYNEKYFKFVFRSGREIIIDRQKSVESIFFFNPDKELLHCDTRGFINEQFRDY